jgi:hypothetical protein
LKVANLSSNPFLIKERATKKTKKRSSPNGEQPFLHAEASGSVIDFLMHRQGGNLGHARKTLRAYAP